MLLRDLFCLAIISTSFSQDVIVPTAYGKVKGRVKKIKDKKYTVFHGIPFAAPPVGDLRWQPPQRHDGWGDSVRDAFEIGPVCPQMMDIDWDSYGLPSRFYEPMRNQEKQDEDCLRLEVYVTGDLSRDAMAPLPVIVFIHGGAFVLGSSCFEPGEVFVTEGQPVVMVTIQYRLGLLGFFTTGDDTISANFGLRDQAFALQWVQENIAAFRGDPKKVTITGESAGGMSVSSHMISPMSAGLFHRACVQSAVTTWLLPKKESLKTYFKTFAETFDCNGPSEEAVTCLREKPWKELFNVSLEQNFCLMSRVIDGEFFTDNPWDSWVNGNFNNAELMVGFTNDDGTVFTNTIDPNFDFVSNRSRDEEFLNVTICVALKANLEDLNDFFSPSIKRYGKLLANKEDLHTVIKARYYDVYEKQLDKARGILDASNDGLFTSYSIWLANQVARFGGHVFVYSFNHVTEALGLEVSGGVELRAPHGSELLYQFGYGFTDPDTVKLTEDESALTRSVIQAWTSFAAGNTSYLTMSGEKTDWPMYTLEEKKVLYFDTNMSPKSASYGKNWQAVVDFWLTVRSLATWKYSEESTAAIDKTAKEEL